MSPQELPHLIEVAMGFPADATRLRSALNRLHWSAQTIATLLDVNERTARRWISGQNPAPDNVLTWLERMAAYMDANPAPRKTNNPSASAPHIHAGPT